VTFILATHDATVPRIHRAPGSPGRNGGGHRAGGLRPHAPRDGAGIGDRLPRAYLTAVATRLCIDHLRSARVRRESYIGTWLPEPVLTDEAANVERHAETADSLSMGFLLLLEGLSPVERAVFLLHEVFDYDSAAIASVVGKTVEDCRQIASRARRHVQAGRPRFEASRAKREELARRFFRAIGEGDVDSVVNLLAADVVAYADGGGKAFAFTAAIHGREHRPAAG
jgi:RNA polymerase sigma-70 factor, ECF subfamily